MNAQDYLKQEREERNQRRITEQQDRKHQDVAALTQAHARVHELLMAQDKYPGLYAQRVLRATKELELLAQELKNTIIVRELTKQTE